MSSGYQQINEKVPIEANPYTDHGKNCPPNIVLGRIARPTQNVSTSGPVVLSSGGLMPLNPYPWRLGLRHVNSGYESLNYSRKTSPFS